MKSLEIVELALQLFKLRRNAIDFVILVGESTHILKLRELLREFFDGKTLTFSINVDETVAERAAYYAELKAETKDVKFKIFANLQDVTPLS